MTPRLFPIVVLLAALAPAAAQVCRLSVAGLNQNRRVMGPVHSECPGNFIVHTAPFGNWGVTSNFGPKRNGHQFQGWCHDTQVCDLLGCHTDCQDGWYEWNSCTDLDPFKAPNCSLYNSKECTEQVSPMGINVLGTQTVDIPVRCPLDTNGDGVFDAGGCADVTSYSHGTNFMSLYELDPAGTDDLVQTIYFPATVVDLKCSVTGCPAAGSAFVPPSGYQNPESPARVYAEMATVVNSGTFINTNNACRMSVPVLTSVSAASLSGPSVAPGSIASGFGSGLAGSTTAATATPLPTELSGTRVTLTDSGGASHAVPLYFVAPQQINYLVPPQAAAGSARLVVSNGAGTVAAGALQIDAVAPGLFAANSGGRGVAAAVAIRVAASGAQTSQVVFQCGTAAGSCVSIPIDLGGPSDQVILLLFGTGIRNARAVTAKIGGADAGVLYSGPQPTFAGLDQVNVRLPRTLAGRGDVDILVTVDGRGANGVTVNVK